MNSIVVAFGVELLTHTHNDPAFRLRRDSDGTTQDIYFLEHGIIDRDAIDSFLEGTTGFIEVWYDQSQFQSHASQNALHNQPRLDIFNLSSDQIESRLSPDFYSTVYFDGDSTHMTANISQMNTNELTAMAWINVTRRHISGNGYDIFSLHHNDCWGTFGVETIGDFDGGTTTKFRYWGCISNNQHATTQENYLLNTWHHIALRINETHLTFYVNGIQDGILTKTGPTNYDGNDLLYFGVWSKGINPSHSYGGHIRDFFLFNRSLSVLEIQDMMDLTNIFIE
ncbi:MAG: LamG-like jellyroll fold domain-containing protein [Candidatus Woesearchaeota archaeon]